MQKVYLVKLWWIVACVVKNLLTRSNSSLPKVHPSCNRVNRLFVHVQPWKKWKGGGSATQLDYSLKGLNILLETFLNEICLSKKMKWYSLMQKSSKNRRLVKKLSARNTRAVCFCVCVDLPVRSTAWAKNGNLGSKNIFFN